MKPIVFIWSGLILLFSSLFTPKLIAQNAKEIITKMDSLRRGETASAQMTISIVRPSWSRQMEVKTWSHGSEYSMILITSPMRDKGTVFLKRTKEIWNWIPSIDRNIKLPPSMMMQSWMGSDFTNDDLIKESSIVKDYEHKIIGDSVINGNPTYKIELIPKPEAAVVWGKILVWVDKEGLYEWRTELYDEDGYLVNEVIFSELKMLDNRLLPSVMEYIPQDKTGHKTIIIYEFVDYDIPISTAFFSLQNMKRVR